MLHIKGDTVRDRLVYTIKALGIKFPGVTIAEKTGYNKATISEYLKSKEPSEAFVRTFCEKFEVDFDSIWTGMPDTDDLQIDKSSVKPQYFTADQLYAMYMKSVERQDKIMDAQIEILNDIRSRMAQQDTQKTIKESVQETASRTEKIEFSLVQAGVKLATLERRQELAIKEFRRQFLELGAHKNNPSKDVRKKEGRKNGNP